jgi:hypothetical protein
MNNDITNVKFLLFYFIINKTYFLLQEISIVRTTQRHHDLRPSHLTIHDSYLTLLSTITEKSHRFNSSIHTK